jgi:cysteine-rich repeat protein
VTVGVEECDDGNAEDGDGCSAACEEQQLCGDADGNGFVLSSDSLAILNVAIGFDVLCPTWICDANGDGEVTALDALMVLTSVVGAEADLACGMPTAVRVRLLSTDLLGLLQLRIDYAGATGEFSGEGTMVDCVSLTPAGTGTFFNDAASSSLTATIFDGGGFAGPAGLMECAFTPTANVESEDFVITVIAATSIDGLPAGPGLILRAYPY